MHRVQFDDLPPDSFLRLPAVMAVAGLKRSTIYELIKKRRFPAPEKLTAHASGWRVHEVKAWLKAPALWRAGGQNAS